ncbi:MarR family winged helix-turn-helix transcriptional regulator [Kitasatospora sp. DSM 101779]|uniref:MarR family winged helix-turn-helix transcriptional regulator n=1 Tax=Kitasatospora sp. DSM 101779 TaxID=2853165 RepID=UPI0021DB4D7D|nr:MarR family transcriptional regulator [Kitasatospora sp. DSM 101779]MCU7826921.1 MarR family transcriptional regulator [Kitasatospora sp. DSM 101779]
MNNSTGHDIADALALLLRRSTRARLYTRLTDGLGEAVDDLTYPVLSGLARTGPRSAADLGREIGLDRTTVTRRADRLEHAGLIQRQPDPADGRATLLALTDDGRTVISATRQRLAAGIEDSLAGWPRDDAQDFARLLRRFVDQGPFAADHD